MNNENIKQKMFWLHTLDLVLSEQCLKVIIPCLEPSLFNRRVEILFKYYLKKSHFSEFLKFQTYYEHFLLLII